MKRAGRKAGMNDNIRELLDRVENVSMQIGGVAGIIDIMAIPFSESGTDQPSDATLCESLFTISMYLKSMEKELDNICSAHI